MSVPGMKYGDQQRQCCGCYVIVSLRSAQLGATCVDFSRETCWCCQSPCGPLKTWSTPQEQLFTTEHIGLEQDLTHTITAPNFSMIIRVDQIQFDLCQIFHQIA